MAEVDPRLQILADGLSSAGSSEAMPAEQLYRVAEELLDELDQQSPDETVRRLQRDLWVAWGNDDVEWNLGRSLQIVNELRDLAQLKVRLKAAFAHDELDGGHAAAYTHPLYLSADARALSLEAELKGLI